MASGWFVYLIECIDGSLYTGIAVDVDKRYAAHVAGKGARYTRSHPPARLIAAIPHPDRSSASIAEHQIKKLTPAGKRKVFVGAAEPRLTRHLNAAQTSRPTRRPPAVPLEYAASKPPAAATMSLNELEILGASILVVDDQRANVELLEHLLGDAGYTHVSSTTNPRDVCALHQENRFDLILLDLQMPGMDGFEVMAGLKELFPDDYLPVLVLTAQPSAKLKALQAGAKDFLSKPFDVLEVQTRIRNMLEVRLLYTKVEDNNRQLEQAVQERTADLRESESRFRSLVELATDWYWEQDENGKFTKVSGPALEMLGLGDKSADDGADQLLWNEQERVQLGEKLAAREPFLDFVYSRIRPDGSEQFLQTSGEPKFDASGRFTGYRGIGSDVTGRMRGAGSRREQDLQRFRNALDSTTHAIFLLDRSTMQFVDVNTTASKMFGYTREELLAMGPEKLAADPGDYDESHYDQLIAGVGDFGRRQAQLRRKDGSLILAEVHRQANRTEHGWLMAEVVRDMTSEK